MISHDPREQIRGIHQILISDKKRIGFLFGAGTSVAIGVNEANVPAIAKMTELVCEILEGHSEEFKVAINEIRIELEARKELFNIETLLTAIETKRTAIGSGALNGLNSEQFNELAGLVKTTIVGLVSVHEKLRDADIRQFAHAKLANWGQKARRRYPAEIFTTNYDYLFEIALEGAGLPYFDGFAGSYEPFFCPEAVEDIGAYPNLLKLWKMHGSLGWVFREKDNAVIRKPQASIEDILIYPSHLKYNASKKQPYVGLIDRLCTFLQQDDAVLFVCGYSFGDPHINERIVTSLRRGSNSAVFAMYYDEAKQEDGSLIYKLADESDLVRGLATKETAGRMSVLGQRHAVIGGKLGEWKLRSEPNIGESIQVSQYFDEDAASLSEEEGEHKGNELWAGTGKFRLPEFGMLADFLNDLSTPMSSDPKDES